MWPRSLCSCTLCQPTVLKAVFSGRKRLKTLCSTMSAEKFPSLEEIKGNVPPSELDAGPLQVIYLPAFCQADLNNKLVPFHILKLREAM